MSYVLDYRCPVTKNLSIAFIIYYSLNQRGNMMINRRLVVQTLLSFPESCWLIQCLSYPALPIPSCDSMVTNWDSQNDWQFHGGLFIFAYKLPLINIWRIKENGLILLQIKAYWNYSLKTEGKTVWNLQKGMYKSESCMSTDDILFPS